MGRCYEVHLRVLVLPVALAACTPSTAPADPVPGDRAPRESVDPGPVEPERVEAEPAAPSEPEPAEPAPVEPAKPVPSDLRVEAELAACEVLVRKSGARYPEALAGLPELASQWESIVPLISTYADVRARFGTPKEEIDIARYGKPYPGDDAAAQPLLIYDHPGPWLVYVYLVRSDLSSSERYHASVQDRVGSVDFLPDGEAPSFAKTRFPSTFAQEAVVAADADWVEFRAPSGLTYSVYGDLGDVDRLNRISFAASDCLRKAGAPAP